jgi:hypothetical protein
MSKLMLNKLCVRFELEVNIKIDVKETGREILIGFAW